MRLRHRSAELDSTIVVSAGDRQLPSISPPVASAARYLSARLSHGSECPSRIAFTSAISGEGVSFVSMAFAATLAHDTRKRVGLVQLNWWDQDIKVVDGRGLSDVLLRGIQLDEAVIETNDPCLALVPSGFASALERATLARDGTVEKLLDVLGTQYDHLVLDLPAVLLTSDALALAELADEVALVVRHGVTSYDQVEDSVRQLGADRLCGLVLNQEQSAIPRLIRRRLGL
jgi:Mrp family chromosome partitioning ATPase